MIIRDGKATYKTDTSTFSFTFPTPEGEETITLTNGKLRKAKDSDLGQLYRYAYFYSSDSSEKARRAFERHIYGLGAASRADARFLAKHAVKALNKAVPLADFNAVCCRTYHADWLCCDLADEINKHGAFRETSQKTEERVWIENRDTSTKDCQVQKKIQSQIMGKDTIVDN